MRSTASRGTSEDAPRADRIPGNGAGVAVGGVVAPDGAARRGTSAGSRLLIDRLRARRRSRESQIAVESVARERRRIAADVHDLVMQDLALALANARTLAAGEGPAVEVGAVVAAGERAFAGARQIVAGLLAEDRTSVVEAVGSSVSAAARSTRLRFCARGVPAGAEPDEPTLDTLVHIGREATTNAVKHGRPHSIEVVLSYDDEWHLTVCDDGEGFDVDAAPRGFGMRSMAQQARALGGRLVVSSTVGSGTVVEVALP